MNFIATYLIIALSSLLFIGCACLKKKKSEEKETTHVQQTDDSSFIKNEILVKLKPDSDINDLIKEFPKYKLAIKKEIGRNQHIYLTHYDTSSIKPAEMLSKIKNVDFVVEAEFNKKITMRR
ncbi:MAG: hypothetical protein JKX95_06915 [Bacteroidia bacterium]|nr:hypothetical protein [Bacteroidia bacterium]